MAMLPPGYGYEELPPDTQGVIRVRTHGQLRLWDTPRNAVSALQRDLRELQFPGVYILIDSNEQRVYIGQSDHLTQRLNQHAQSPLRELTSWDRALVITDGRPLTLSDFAEAVIRESLESALIRQFQSGGGFSPANRQRRELQPSIWQAPRFERLWRELVSVLQQRRLLPWTAAAQVSEELMPPEIFRARLESRGYQVSAWGAYEAQVNGLRCFIRDGSQKPRGWQITLRNDFRNAARTSDGHLLVNRGPGLMIPFAKLRALAGTRPLEQGTVDIFIKFLPEGRVTVRYRENEADISDTKLG